MIESKPGILNETINPVLTVPIEEEEHKQKVIDSVTLPKYNTLSLNIKNNTRTVMALEVSNIYNDNGDFIIELPSHRDGIDVISIRVPRDLMKKVIYDVYLT